MGTDLHLNRKTIRNYAVAKEVRNNMSVIARSEATKQSVLAAWEIATGLRPRNDSPILCLVNNSETIFFSACSANSAVKFVRITG